LNCGDGRWERDFIDQKIIKRATAFDVSPDLIETAKKAKGKRSIEYFVADANKVNFPNNKFDLVVNYAALHHTQYINRICRILAHTLKPGGIFVNFEYIGPHRNQFPIVQWLLAHRVNYLLPNFFKQDLHYPHIPTMLVMDPTEAIHSELIVKTVKRYFDIIEKHDTGGGIAYLLLTHNQKVSRLPVKKVNKYIDKILRHDERYSRFSLVPQLFSYFIARPDKAAIRDTKKVKTYQDKENARERLAAQRRGVYSFVDYLKLVKNCRTLKEGMYLLSRYPYLVNPFSIRD
jgi:ubiquinone/menaquinone biosynthesis C-methylase UbiE